MESTKIGPRPQTPAIAAPDIPAKIRLNTTAIREEYPRFPFARARAKSNALAVSPSSLTRFPIRINAGTANREKDIVD